jgi:hypothetical protein
MREQYEKDGTTITVDNAVDATNMRSRGWTLVQPPAVPAWDTSTNSSDEE